MVATLVAMLCAGTVSARAQNVVLNGGFDNIPAAAPGGNGLSPEPPWVFNGLFSGAANAGPNVAHSPPNVAAISAAVSGFGGFPGSASQVLAVNRGGVYTLSYFAANVSTGQPVAFRVTSSINGKQVLTSIVQPASLNGPTLSYQHETARVRVRRGTPTLNIAASPIFTTQQNVTSLLLLDDVSLTYLHGLAIDFRKLNLTQNERAVANALYNATRLPNTQQGPLYNALSKVSNAGAPAVLDSLSGEGIAASQNIAFRAAQLFNSAIFDQTTFYGSGGAANSVTLTQPQPGFVALAQPDETLAASSLGQRVRELADLPRSKAEPAMPPALIRTWRAWGTGFGGVENINGNGVIGSARQDNSIIGGALGVDYQLLPNYLVGIAVGGTDGTFRVPGRATSGSTDGGHIAIYDLATFGKFYGASSTSFSYYGNRATRITGGFGGLASETERSNFESHEFRSRLEFGRHLDGSLSGLDRFGALTPFVALEIAELRSNGFNERPLSGPGLLGLSVQGQSIASAPAFAGLRLQRTTPLGNGLVFSPTLQVAYVHEFAPYRSQTAQITSLPGSVFLIEGARPARDAAQVKAGGELAVGAQAAVFANFDGEFSGVNQLYAGKGGFKYLW